MLFSSVAGADSPCAVDRRDGASWREFSIEISNGKPVSARSIRASGDPGMRAQQGNPGIGIFLLAALRKMIAVITVERGDVAVGIGTVKNAAPGVRQRGLRPGNGIIRPPVLVADAASGDEERRP